MKGLDNLKPSKGSNRASKRLGRGTGSNWGKTGGKGHKGQKARKGGKVAPGFEGGQTPLYRRLPKRGFRSIFRKEYQVVNVSSLNRFDAGATVSPEELKTAGLIRDAKGLVKLLADGELTKKLSLKVHKASKAAKEAISGQGGEVEEIK